MSVGKRPPRRVLEDLYKNKHMTLQEIGTIYGVSRQRVHQWIDTYGIQRIHSQYEDRVRSNPKISKKTLTEYISKGFKISSIAVKTKLGVKGTQILMEKYGLNALYEEVQNSGKKPNSCFNSMPSRKTIEELYNQDISIRKILNELGVSQKTFYKWLEYYGFERRTPHHQASHHRPIIYKPAAWVAAFTEDYYTMPTKDLLAKYGCGIATIYIWLNKYNIPRKQTVLRERGGC